jgi:hypothetical protein
VPVKKQHIATQPPDVVSPAEQESPLSIPAIARFAEAVSSDVDQHLTAEVVEARLAVVRQEARDRAAAGHLGEGGFAQELARYGYTQVRIWLQMIRIEMQGVAAIGRQTVGLDEPEIHDLAKETAARAIAGFREDLAESRDDRAVRTALLAECVRRLPDAYRSRLLHLGKLGYELDEELGQQQPVVGLHLIGALRHCMTRNRGETAQILRTWTDSAEQRDEIIEATRAALERAVRLYPEIDPDGPVFFGLPDHRRRP